MLRPLTTEWAGGEGASSGVRAVMDEARAGDAGRRLGPAVPEGWSSPSAGGARAAVGGGQIMGELAALRETLAPFHGRKELDQLQMELARLREGAQEAAKRIAERGASKDPRSTPPRKSNSPQETAALLSPPVLSGASFSFSADLGFGGEGNGQFTLMDPSSSSADPREAGQAHQQGNPKQGASDSTSRHPPPFPTPCLPMYADPALCTLLDGEWTRAGPSSLPPLDSQQHMSRCSIHSCWQFKGHVLEAR